MKKILCALICLISGFVLGFSAITAFASSRITVTASSNRKSQGPEVAFDRNEDTYWHSDYTAEGSNITWKAEYPHTLILDFGKTATADEWRYVPRHDNAVGTFLEYSLYASGDGENFTKIMDGSFDYPNGYEAVSAKFKKTTARYFKIEATKTVSGYGTAAEIQFLLDGVDIIGNAAVSNAAAEGKPSASNGILYLDRTGWTAGGESFPSNPASKALDGNEDSYWHSHYDVENGVISGRKEPPFELTFTLPRATNVSGFTLLPRSDMNIGRITKAELYGSEGESGEFTRITDALSFSEDIYAKEVELTANLSLKRVKLVILEATGNYGTLAEFYAWENDPQKEIIALSDYYEYNKLNAIYKIDNSNIVATYNGECWGGCIPGNVVDGNSSFWQTAQLESFPIDLDIDLEKVCELKRIVYTTRQSQDLHGCWLKVSISLSTDGEKWEDALPNVVLGKILSPQIIELPYAKEARYVKFTINEAHAERASCSELEFYQTGASFMKNNIESKRTYVIKVDSNIIKWELDNGETIEKGEAELSSSPFIFGGSVMLPLRSVLGAMGADVSWQDDTKNIIVATDKKTITLQAWNRLVYVNDRKLGNIRYTLLNYPIIRDGMSYVPIRFLSEQMGYEVVWDDTEKTVTITRIES